MSPITTPAQLMPRLGLTDVHELPTSPFDLEEFFRAIRNWLRDHREAPNLGNLLAGDHLSDTAEVLRDQPARFRTHRVITNA
jgi:hypothetical protein